MSSKRRLRKTNAEGRDPLKSDSRRRTRELSPVEPAPKLPSDKKQRSTKRNSTKTNIFTSQHLTIPLFNKTEPWKISENFQIRRSADKINKPRFSMRSKLRQVKSMFSRSALASLRLSQPSQP